MPKVGKKFTTKLVDNLKPKASPYRLWEGVGDSFGVQVSPASKKNPEGKKTFFMTYRFGHDPKIRYCSLGDYVSTDKHSLKKAKDELKKMKELLKRGIEPQLARQEEKERNIKDSEEKRLDGLEEQGIGTVKQLFEFYTEQMKADNKSSWQEVRRSLYNEALCPSGKSIDNKFPEDKKAKDVTPQDIRKILFNPVSRGALVVANRLRSYLSAAFNYGIGHDLDSKNLNHNIMFQIETNPARDVPKPKKKEETGKRNLSWEEINVFWHSIDNLQILDHGHSSKTYKTRLSDSLKDLILQVRQENPLLGKVKINEILRKRYGVKVSDSNVGRVISANEQKGSSLKQQKEINRCARALKIILATGQRVTEVLNSSPNDFNFKEKIWEMPNTKNGRMHVVVLNDFSISIIKPLVDKAILEGHKYLFPKVGTGKNGIEEEPMPETTLSQYVTRFCFEKLTVEQVQAGKKPREKFKKFTPRDLRRTWKTRMGELGVPKHIRDIIQNHALGDVSSRHYDLYGYIAEKRDAMNKWSNRLQNLIDQGK